MKKLSLAVAAGALAVSLPLAAVEVSTVDELVAALESMNPTATASDEIVLAAGTYNLTGIAQKYYDGGWKACVILFADRLNPDAQNILLKTLEEPPPNTILLLVTASPATLLATVRSAPKGLSR